ncbi:MAG TPA: ABC transporter substrate-binding protein [Rhizomicrobium sp.]|jgi:phospholipid transport system substrate-binding protein|nr:ABC transporter substrate-binding protein [Rhizomicrobium sp.]
MKCISTAHRAFGVALLATSLSIGVTATTAPQPAVAQTSPGLSGAENYVSANVQRGLTILNNHNLPDAERRAQFRDFLTSLTDIRRIAVFTLGAARRTASPAQVEAFVDAFRNYAVSVYESRLKAYAGQYLKVVGGREHGPGDYIVQTILVDPTGRTEQQGEPIEVDFRVDNSGGRFVVIDVAIAGVWLALEERDQFTAFLEENNGNLGALITHLNELAVRLHGGGPATPVR